MRSHGHSVDMCWPSLFKLCFSWLRKVRRYQRSNQNPYIEEEQTIQWPKGQTTIYKTKDRKNTKPTKNWGWFHVLFGGGVNITCSICGTHRATPVIKPVTISRHFLCKVFSTMKNIALIINHLDALLVYVQSQVDTNQTL